jgi:hypothetical protein
MTAIKDLIDLPEHVHRGDFVLRLMEGIKMPADTLRDFVVTPQLVERREHHARLFGSLRAVVVDEIHAFAADDRGWLSTAGSHGTTGEQILAACQRSGSCQTSRWRRCSTT